jgi:NAD-dependent deacetylase
MDGLHDRAGSEGVIKLHGDIWLLRRTTCGHEERNEQVPIDPLPPRCSCGGLRRPGIVGFGELLPQDRWLSAVDAAHNAEVFISIGTFALVYPAAGLVRVARKSGARIAIFNSDPTPADKLAHWIPRGPAGEILPRLL